MKLVIEYLLATLTMISPSPSHGIPRPPPIKGCGFPGISNRFPVKQAELVPRQCRHCLSAADRGAGSGRWRLHPEGRGPHARAANRRSGRRLAPAWGRCYLPGNDGFPPLHLKPAKIQPGGVVKVRGDVSSQFLTGLLMALPLTGETVAVDVVGELISKPYIEITLAIMARFGVVVSAKAGSDLRCRLAVATFRPGRVYVEGDASSASYFLALGAIGGGPVRVEGVGQDSIQGDVKFAEALAKDGGHA
jgi:3-phosphoshikimate 1-carboxyvinyltransferase